MDIYITEAAANAIALMAARDNFAHKEDEEERNRTRSTRAYVEEGRIQSHKDSLYRKQSSDIEPHICCTALGACVRACGSGGSNH